mmetsp:Transcript_7033/g.11828  ORF Transcript_7033/g.11828 Transcript_7033/m.11828 type:complete len:101 (+) Transcript_7033:413-715(+)
MFPLKGALKVTRGLIIDFKINGKKMEVVSIKRTSEPPEALLKPGISPQKENGSINHIMFLGGNQKKQCYLYNIQTDTWKKAGELPLFHLVTQQINCNYMG